jgi:hypothetical protein
MSETRTLWYVHQWLGRHSGMMGPKHGPFRSHEAAEAFAAALAQGGRLEPGDVIRIIADEVDRDDD